MILDTVFVIPILDKYLLYSPKHVFIALINKQAVAEIYNILATNTTSKHHKYLSPIIEVINQPVHKDIGALKGGFNPCFLGIVLSRRCNMKCSYCNFEPNTSPKEKVDLDKALALIDYFVNLKKKQGHSSCAIEFFGGEPFVEDNLISIIVHRSRYLGSMLGINPCFSAVTNGYLTPKQRVFIEDYFDSIVVSCDGFMQHHNRNRKLVNGKSSYRKVFATMKQFSKADIEFAIRCCVTKDSVHDMADMAEWFCTEFKPDLVNFEVLTENAETIEAGISAPAPDDFAINLVKSWRILEKHNVKYSYAPVSLQNLNISTCPVGNDALILHPDGVLASCYLGKDEWQNERIDFSLGEVGSDGVVSIDIDKVFGMREHVQNKPICDDCFCRFSCAGNCHVNTLVASKGEEKSSFCKQTRIITACELLHNMNLLDLEQQFLANHEALHLLNSANSDKLAKYVCQ
ncbi:MAG: radical SAM protein [Candidatus Cloacimonas sp.]|jgi:uncharacterized protein|nr:radical SAM protein [Candidatus Cloacimonas sp.]